MEAGDCLAEITRSAGRRRRLYLHWGGAGRTKKKRTVIRDITEMLTLTDLGLRSKRKQKDSQSCYCIYNISMDIIETGWKVPRTTLKRIDPPYQRESGGQQTPKNLLSGSCI